MVEIVHPRRERNASNQHTESRMRSKLMERGESGIEGFVHGGRLKENGGIATTDHSAVSSVARISDSRRNLQHGVEYNVECRLTGAIGLHEADLGMGCIEMHFVGCSRDDLHRDEA